MKYNLQILISKHAVERYLSRFPHNIKTGDKEEDERIAERCLQDLWATARYVSDDESGVLFRADGIDMIVKNRKVVTILEPKKTKYFINNKGGNNGNPINYNSERYNVSGMVSSNGGKARR